MPTALLSVYDKTGLIELAHGLRELGWALLASGGTARALRGAGCTVTEVADYTGSPEILGGRVKTLHPAIHGGLLARAEEADREALRGFGWSPIDLAVVNLYPFEQTIARSGATVAEAIEQIDIGGVALIRAAAKNHARVTLLCDPADYQPVLADLRAAGVSLARRRQLAAKGFALTAGYDQAITRYLAGGVDEQHRAKPFDLRLYPAQALRYGENPHQTAMLYTFTGGGGPLGGEVLQGRALSYTNLLDLDAAWNAAASFDAPAICIVKHLSPCGIACAANLAEAFAGALASDPISAFGGVVAANREFDAAAATALGDLFVEGLAAPGFSADARAILAARQNCRLVRVPQVEVADAPGFELRSIRGGVLGQSPDRGDPPGTEWRVVSQRAPTEAEWRALRFAWRACQHVKSNAIVLARDEATVGIGGGQPNRVDCVRIAVDRAGSRARGAVMASDAFFPFPDAVEAAIAADVTAIVHPGGSVRDALAVAAADQAGLAMVITGVRHFRH